MHVHLNPNSTFIRPCPYAEHVIIQINLVKQHFIEVVGVAMDGLICTAVVSKWHVCCT